MKASAVSAIITFHGEGLVANKTLLGLERVRTYSEARGVPVEFVAVLDAADEETARVVGASPVLRKDDQVIAVSNEDLGASRNSGVATAKGAFIGIFDGDDFYTENWLCGAMGVAREKKGRLIVHPELAISFGATHAVGDSWDMDERRDYALSNCFAVNPWTSCSFGERSIYLEHPYCRTDSAQTGFRFEDWHWNLELLGHGIRHVAAKGTALFYRRKPSSMMTRMMRAGAVVRPSMFFDRTANWKPGERTGE